LKEPTPEETFVDRSGSVRQANIARGRASRRAHRGFV